MIQVVNKDSSFFLIESPDMAIGEVKKGEGKVNNLLQDKVIAFTVNEEMGKTTTGSLQIYDPNHVYSRILRNGMRFNITWGYKNREENLLKQGVNDSNPNEITGSAERKGLKCVVHVPSGNASQDGNIIYNVSFYSQEIFTGRIVKRWSGQTYGDVVKNIFTQFGIAPTEQTIDFSLANSELSNDTALIQEETNYKFLMKLAYEWRTIFQIGYNPRGGLVGVFIDPAKVESIDYVRRVCGARGYYRTFEYRDGRANVISYSWNQHVGDQGTGDGVRLTVVKGQTVIQRYTVKDETITTWKFNPEKIRTELEARDSFIDKNELVKEWLKLNDFDELVKRGFFIPESQTTAPQGFGYTITMKVLGDPLITTPMRVNFGLGFPDRIRQADTTDVIKRALTSFFLKKVTHSISNSGYLCDLEVADAITVNGGAVQ